MNRGVPSSSGEQNSQGDFCLPALNGFSAESIRKQMDRILASPGFCHADRMSRFVRLAVENTLQGRANELKEYVIGSEVFDRHHDYDPRTDPIVRVEARRLRAKLEEYYQGEGKCDPLRIEFPKGSYVPVFKKAEPRFESTESLPRVPVFAEVQMGDRKVQRFFNPRVIWMLPVALGVIAVCTWWWLHPIKRAPRPSAIQLVADFAPAGGVSLSGDGKFVAYSTDRDGEGGRPSIYVREVSGGEPLRLTHHWGNDTSPVFSADGSKIVFRRSPGASDGLYLIPTLGGEARKITNEGSHPDISPDGKWMAYDKGAANPPLAKVYLAPIAGGAAKQFLPEFSSALLPHWSPDGKRLLFVGCRDQKKNEWDWWVAPPEGGQPVKTGAWQLFDRLGFRDALPGQWIAAGNSVVFSARVNDTTHLWKVSLSSRTYRVLDEPTQVTFGSGEECCPSLSNDGQMAFLSVNRESQIVGMTVDANRGLMVGSPRVVARGTYHHVIPSASADGSKVAFMTPHLQSWDLRLKDQESHRETVLVEGVPSPVVDYPAISRDGSKIVYMADENGRSALYVIPTTAISPQKVCDDCGLPYEWSADGTQILYLPYRHGRPFSVWLLRIDSGERVEVLKHSQFDLLAPRFSPDGRWISFHAGVSDHWNRTVFVAPYRDGRPAPESEWIPITDGLTRNCSAAWSPDGNLLYFQSDRDATGECTYAQHLNSLTKKPVGSPCLVYHYHPRGMARPVWDVGETWMSVSSNTLFVPFIKGTASVWLTKLEE